MPFASEYVSVWIGIWPRQTRLHSAQRPISVASPCNLGNRSPLLPLWPRSWALKVFARQKEQTPAVPNEAHKTAFHSSQGARHAVLRTLYSRARRIGLDVSSCLLWGLRKSLSFDLFLAVVVRVLACPALELVVLLEQQLEGLADDVGRVRINEIPRTCPG